MAVSQELIGFVREGLGRGMSRESVANVLASAGWPAAQIRDALDAFADVESPVPVPRPRPYLSAREAFTHLVLFVALYLSAYHFATLVFDLIDTALPDATNHRTLARVRESVRWATAALIVVFPLFLVTSARTMKAARLDPTLRSSKMRRQLTYATMFVASCVLIGDVTTLLYFALGGELTVGFVLKVATVAIVAGAAFAFCLWHAREGERSDAVHSARGRMLAGLATLAILAAFGLAARMVGTPGEAREARIDERRVDTLNSLTHAVDVYYGRHKRLPDDLRALAEVSDLQDRDPVTGEPYEYRVRGPRSYELCAVFQRATATGATSDFWWHGAGRQCYTVNVRDAGRSPQR